MRAVAALLLLAALAGCERQSGFDETYEERSRTLTDMANEIERDLGHQMNAATPTGSVLNDAGGLPPVERPR